MLQDVRCSHMIEIFPSTKLGVALQSPKGLILIVAQSYCIWLATKLKEDLVMPWPSLYTLARSTKPINTITNLHQAGNNLGPHHKFTLQ